MVLYGNVLSGPMSGEIVCRLAFKRYLCFCFWIERFKRKIGLHLGLAMKEISKKEKEVQECNETAPLTQWCSTAALRVPDSIPAWNKCLYDLYVLCFESGCLCMLF